MKQKLIAMGSDGCHIVSAMLDAGLFKDSSICLCDISKRNLAKYGNLDCPKVLLGGTPFRYALSADDTMKIDSILDYDNDTALILVTAIGGRTEAKYVPEFIIEAARRNFKTMVIYTIPKLEVPSPKYDRYKRAEIVIAKFMQGRIVLLDTDISDLESVQKIIGFLKKEGTEFDASGIAAYCRNLRGKYPSEHGSNLIIQPDNYPWASFEERIKILNEK